ncbi:uncharacterized protein ARMOST_15138 [Armillaria ostoyae]|uniref:Uncharacterized protein n=1 Tax=Armillaria ostoyae TaxID=47428 RepID=A0A284RSL0_ARMOS|nr:uncharacterized protein ARMOST_15138 [Armillaria ostoyae]
MASSGEIDSAITSSKTILASALAEPTRLCATLASIPAVSTSLPPDSPWGFLFPSSLPPLSSVSDPRQNCYDSSMSVERPASRVRYRENDTQSSRTVRERTRSTLRLSLAAARSVSPKA